MAVFGEDDRTVAVLVETCYLARRGIVGRVDGSRRWEALALLALEEAAEVAAHLWIAVGARRVELRLHIVAQTDADVCQRVLVAQTPDEYRRMVLVATDGGLGALLQHGIELFLREVLVAVAEGHLVDDVEAERVGQFVESWLAGVVRGADVVHRGFLHQLHVAKGQVIADDLH